MGLRGTSLAYAAMLRPLSVLLCALALVLAACGGDDDDKPAAEQKAASSAPAEQQGRCKDVAQPTPRDGGGQTKPKQPLDTSKTYELELRKNKSSFTIRVDQKTSPQATASFASLARNGFFDKT